jgi:hypothetical protein
LRRKDGGEEHRLRAHWNCMHYRREHVDKCGLHGGLYCSLWHFTVAYKIGKNDILSCHLPRAEGVLLDMGLVRRYLTSSAKHDFRRD